jgi:hypothetical protein
MRRIAVVPVLVAALSVLLRMASLAAVAPMASAQGVGAEPSRWWGEVDRVGRLLEGGRWKKVLRQGEELRAEVVGGGWREPDLSQVLVELAFQLAVAHAESGDEERALWEWQSALLHERHGGGTRSGEPPAERDLSAYPRAAELFAGSGLRSEGEYPEGHPPVTIRPGIPFEPATAPEWAPPPLVNNTATKERVAPVHFEVFVAPSGEISRPALITEWSHPLVVQWGLDSLRAAPRFTPARMEGEAIGWLVPVELTVSSEPPKRW